MSEEVLENIPVSKIRQSDFNQDVIKEGHNNIERKVLQENGYGRTAILYKSEESYLCDFGWHLKTLAEQQDEEKIPAIVKENRKDSKKIGLAMSRLQGSNHPFQTLRRIHQLTEENQYLDFDEVKKLFPSTEVQMVKELFERGRKFRETLQQDIEELDLKEVDGAECHYHRSDKNKSRKRTLNLSIPTNERFERMFEKAEGEDANEKIDYICDKFWEAVE